MRARRLSAGICVFSRAINMTGAFYRDIRKTLSAGHVWSGRLTNRKKDGIFIRSGGHVLSRPKQSGAIINYVSIYRDITRQVKLEKDLRHAQQDGGYRYPGRGHRA